MQKEVKLGIDNLQRCPPEEILNRWKSTCEMCRRSGGNPFSSFYIAASVSKFDILAKLIEKDFGITRGSVYVTTVNQDQRDLRPILYGLAGEIAGKHALLLARGFENTIATLTDVYLLNRFGHDWDQDVKEDWNLRERLIKQRSHVIVLTQIGRSLGNDAYEKSIKTALISQFSDGIIEIVD